MYSLYFMLDWKIVLIPADIHSNLFDLSQLPALCESAQPSSYELFSLGLSLCNEHEDLHFKEH